MNQNFLADYQTCTSGNEAHPNYHIWCGLVALSSIISRRVWLNFGHFNIYPNLYCVLLGPPGNKKTFAMDIAKDLLEQICAGDLKKIPFSCESQSKEQLVKEMHSNLRKFIVPDTKQTLEYAPISIFVTELSQFLGTQTAAHMLDFLTTVWSAKSYTRGTLMHGKEIIPGPYVTMLACTTPDWITTYLKTDIVSGGYARRVNFVFEPEDGEPNPFPTIEAEQAAAFLRCRNYGTELLEVGGQFQWSNEARAFYGPWYIHHQKNLPKDENLRFYYKTKWVQLVKVAMLVSLAKSKELILCLESLKTAMAILEITERNLPRVFAGMGRNELSQISNKCVEILQMNGGPMLEKQVKATLFQHADGREQYQILEHLIQSDRIVVFEHETTIGEVAVKRRYLALPEQIEEAKKKGLFK